MLSLFCLFVSVCEVSMTLYAISLILSWTALSLLMSPSKLLFISVTVFLEFPLDSSSEFLSLCLQYLSVIAVVYSFHLKPITS